MEANTYPDPRVSRLINETVVPVQFNVSVDVGALNRYHVHWTPAFFYYDTDDNEFRRSFGPLNPDQFIGEFWLARGLRWFSSGHFDKSVEIFEQALEHTRNDPYRHPENLYWIGPAKFEGSGTLEDLLEGFKKLQETYPDNDWTLKSKQLKFD